MSPSSPSNSRPDRGSVTPDDLIARVDETSASVLTKVLDFSFNELADMYAEKELVITPEYQRLFRWSEGAQSRFIESLILDLPIPQIFLQEVEDRRYELIDGLQRISSYLHFVGRLEPNDEDGDEGPLTLVDCDLVEELNGQTYESLPSALKIKCRRSYVRAEILQRDSDRSLQYHLFKRLNTGGEQLSEQEIRNALIRILSSDFVDMLDKLSENEDFRASTPISDEQEKRMYRQELALRFFAFKNSLNDYDHSMADFLTGFMEQVSDPKRVSETNFSLVEERVCFEKTFRLCGMIESTLKWNPGTIFGAVPRGATKPRGQFASFHYDAIAACLGRIVDQIDLDDGQIVQNLADATEDGKFSDDFRELTGGGKNFGSVARKRDEVFATRYQQVLGGSR